MERITRRARYLTTLILLALLVPASVPPSGADGPDKNQKQDLDDVLQYISTAWGSLTRSMDDCKTLSDPKSTGRAVLYFPEGFAVPAGVQALEGKCSIRIEHLPVILQKLGQPDARDIQPPGLLYLPHPYVVPGGMFNEMYGWDSYFIVRGLLQAGKLDLARGMVENFFFEIDQYGGVLNANRSYYLTRSQPPFLTSMILAVYEAGKAKGGEDRAWLEEAYPYAVRDYELWTHEPHLAVGTELSRFYDFGDGPVPELKGEADEYYRHAARYFLLHPGVAGPYLVRLEPPSLTPTPVGPQFSVYVCDRATAASAGKEPAWDNRCESVNNVGLSTDFYKGDRAMRESGFDTTFEFGPFGAATDDYAPVGLNSLVYKEEKDLEWISRQLGLEQESRNWAERAEARRDRIEEYLWNAHRGLYFDYDFKTHRQSSYVYATTFYPLWAGLASAQQAAAVAQNLKLLEQPGGLAMSREESGAQWDYPYGWAPIQLIAVEGLRRYGREVEADRLSVHFLATVVDNFRRDGTLREKYNVVTRSSETKIEVGYKQNVVGFGWTNGVFLVLLQALPGDLATRLALLSEPSTGAGSR